MYVVGTNLLRAGWVSVLLPAHAEWCCFKAGTSRANDNELYADMLPSPDSSDSDTTFLARSEGKRSDGRQSGCTEGGHVHGTGLELLTFFVLIFFWNARFRLWLPSFVQAQLCGQVDQLGHEPLELFYEIWLFIDELVGPLNHLVDESLPLLCIFECLIKGSLLVEFFNLFNGIVMCIIELWL